MTFEQDYNKLIAYAKKSINSSKIDNYLPEDAVNDTYIYFIESGKEYSKKAAENKIFNLISEETSRIKLSLSDIKQKSSIFFVDSETEKPCCICKEVKPISLFYLHYSKKYERKIVSNRCISCNIISVKKAQAKKLVNTGTNRILGLWRKNNPDKWDVIKKICSDKCNDSSKVFYYKNLVKIRDMVNKIRK